mmetsp:Transcript_6449/g.21560  ORF Transcript_6449/g.21560 Transcript_6449/m.21560 type:complete len:237 (-) Transcript_6449:963-1673(-)
MEKYVWAADEVPVEGTVRSGDVYVQGCPLERARRSVGADLTGVGVWRAAEELAKELRAGKFRIAGGSRVLELGAGAGLVGVVAASLGATVVLTERPLPGLLSAIERNIDANRDAIARSGGSASAHALDWSASEESLASLKRGGDDGGDCEDGAIEWIFGSEVVYKRADLPQLARVVRGLSTPRRTQTLLAFRERWPGQRDRVVEAVTSAGLTVSDAGEACTTDPSPIIFLRLTLLQ